MSLIRRLTPAPAVNEKRCSYCKKAVHIGATRPSAMRGWPDVELAADHMRPVEAGERFNRNGRRLTRIMCEGSLKPVMVDL